MILFLLDINMQLYSCSPLRNLSLMFSVSFSREWRVLSNSRCCAVSRSSFYLRCNAQRMFGHPTRDSQVFKLLYWVSLGLKLLLALKNKCLQLALLEFSYGAMGYESGVVTAVAWVQSLPWELLHGLGVAKKKKKICLFCPVLPIITTSF